MRLTMRQLVKLQRIVHQIIAIVLIIIGAFLIKYAIYEQTALMSIPGLIMAIFGGMYWEMINQISEIDATNE